MKNNAGALLSSIRIDRKSKRKINLQLYRGLREIILSGGLQAGERLPASRTLAKELLISRTTVIDAFDKLISEGLLESHVGAGTFVSDAVKKHQAKLLQSIDIPATNGKQPRLSYATQQTRNKLARRDRLPHKSEAFISALPALDAFPMNHWARLSARHWRSNREHVMGYGHPYGLPALRKSIAAHLNTSRGIPCHSEQIFITSGAQQAFEIIGRTLLNPGESVWFENPGAIGARNALIASGANLIPVSIDDQGLNVEEAQRKAPHFRLAFTTPSHQQPLGCVMSLPRRLALLQAAHDTDGYIIEDDYDGEFDYGNQTPPPLKSIDHQDRVFYVGTFSKSLFPALRIGYVLVPANLIDIFQQLSKSWLSGTPSCSQSIISDFIDEGLFATHIRLMRKTYKSRHDALIQAGTTLQGRLDLKPTCAGFHTIGVLPKHVSQSKFVEAARQRNVLLSPLERYCISPIKTNGLVLGFGSINPNQISKGIQCLAQLSEFTPSKTAK